MKSLLITFTIIISSIGFSQNLSLNEIIELRKKNLVEFEEYLNNRGWEFFDSEKNNELNIITFAYNKNDYRDSAESFLSLFFTEDYSYTQIWMQINRKEKYIEYLDKVKSFNPKLIDSKIETNGIKKVYQGDTTTFEFLISKMENDYSSSQSEFYTLEIYENRNQ